MQALRRRVVKVKRVEYAISVPCDAKELGKALHLIHRRMQEEGRDLTYDDAYHVTANEEEIVLSYTVEEITP